MRPKVVFIPGIDGAPYSGDRILETLADGADCAQFLFPCSNHNAAIAPAITEFPGLAGEGLAALSLQGARAANDSVEAMADAVAAWMEGMGWESASVIGESYGGAIAQLLAKRRPNRVERLAMVSSFTRHPARVWGFVVGSALRWMPRATLKYPIMASARMTVLRGIERDRRKRWYEMTMQMPFDDIGRREIALRKFNLRGVLRPSDWPPVLWLWGEQERLVNFREEMKWLKAKGFADRIVVIEGAGHVIPSAQRAVVTAHLRSFIGVNTSSAREPAFVVSGVRP